MATQGLFSLEGRVAMVTGASSGLGVRFAEVSAAYGARVVLVARRADRLTTLRDKIVAAGGAALALEADVNDGAAMSRAFDAAEAAFGTVDLFVANAGIGVGGPPSSVTRDNWDRVMRTNVDALFFGAQEAAGRMIAAGKGGAIVTISSIGGILVPLGLSAYGVTKSAVIQITRLMAAEYGKAGIRVNSLAPGWITSEMSADFINSDAGKTHFATLPLGRHGDPEDLDGAFLLLASDAGRFITGVTLPVDGGSLVT